MKKNKLLLLILINFLLFPLTANSQTFDEWRINFSKYASSQGVSDKTLLLIIDNLKFLPKVIEYDRYQPEFYEDTKTYVSKRSSNNKVKIGIKTYQKNIELINKVEKSFKIEKELLLSLMGIETNF